MAAALALDGFPGRAVVASLATDGIDGASDGAGGIVDDTTLARGLRLGLAPPAAFLAENDTRNYLGPLGDLILTGPTGTNVADIVALLATPAARKGYNAGQLPRGHLEPGSRRRPRRAGKDRTERGGSRRAFASSCSETGEAEHLERRARLAEDRLTEVLTAYRQVKTENEGFRDRVTRDVERQFNKRHERLLLKFIDILDNLDRALEAAEQTYAGNPLIEGLILVRTQLLQTLQQEGLERIPVLGLPFDPAMSEAVGTKPVDEPEHDHVVVKEVLRGYRLHGRVARASRVFIGKHVEGGAAAALAAEEKIGADEAEAAAKATDEAASAAADALADTTPIDEAMMRELFGTPKSEEPTVAGRCGS